MRDVGFVDVVDERTAWAKGEKMKRLGAWCEEDMEMGLQGLSMAVFSRGLGMFG
jgi:hypothetical protein